MSFMEIIVGALTTLAVAVVGVWGMSVANKHQKGTREDRLIDQLQEELDKIKDKQAEMNRRMAHFEVRDQTYIPFILKQHQHIELNLGPPAPPLPQIIQDFLAEGK